MKKAILLVVAGLLSIHSCLSQVKEERKVSDFNRIKSSSALKVIINFGDTEKLVFESSQDLLPKLKADVKNGELNLYLSGTNKTNNNTVAYVTVKNLKSISADGASSVECDGPATLEKLDLFADGASSIKLELKAEELNLNLDGAASIKLTGQSHTLNAKMNGASSLNAEALNCENIDVMLDGASVAKVNATNNLTGNVTGASCVNYSGEPKDKDLKFSGAGFAKKK